MSNELTNSNQAFLIYQDENGIARVNVRFDGEDVWLTAEQIMELFDASQQNVSHHIRQIYTDGEQQENRTHKKFLLVRQEGNRSVKRNISHYNLDMIIAVGYRVKSQVATRKPRRKPLQNSRNTGNSKCCNMRVITTEPSRN